MLKAIGITILIIAFLNFSGCFSMNQINREEFSHQTNMNAAIVITKSFEKYEFETGCYRLKADTLIGIGTKYVSDSVSIPFTGKIPLNDIEIYNLDKADTGKTLLLITGIILGSIIVVTALYTIAFAHLFDELSE